MSKPGKQASAAKPSVKPESPGDGRPVIIVSTDEHIVSAEACRALASEQDLYQRGGMLVHVVKSDDDETEGAAIRRPVGTLAVREIPRALLRERLTRCARWMAWRGQRENAKLVPVHPPNWAVEAIHLRGNWPGVRFLDAVISHPLLLPDGSILTESGYHASLRVYASLPLKLKLTVPDKPTKADVAAAVAVLFDVICDFPFETDAHRSAWLAALLTPLAWYSFTGPAPLFLVDGNVRGIGKGKLANVISLILTGRNFPVMAYSHEREEMRKRITTLAVEGDTSALLDNLSGLVGNDVLDGALTTGEWKDRILGSNRQYNGPLHVVWYATGNNVQLAADTSRRVCHIRMETTEEKPEFRADFKYPKLREYILANRGPLLSAALTILRGWAVAGKPSHGLPPWGSFEGWSDAVREAVVFAGLTDPGETRLALQTTADRDAAAMTLILKGMIEMDEGRRGLTVADLIGKLKVMHDSPPEWMSDMRSAIEELCGNLDGRKLAYKLRHFQRRNFDGMMLDKGGQDRGSNRWIVHRLSEGPGEARRRDGADATGRPANDGRLPFDWRSQMPPD